MTYKNHPSFIDIRVPLDESQRIREEKIDEGLSDGTRFGQRYRFGRGRTMIQVCSGSTRTLYSHGVGIYTTAYLTGCRRVGAASTPRTGIFDCHTAARSAPESHGSASPVIPSTTSSTLKVGETFQRSTRSSYLIQKEPLGPGCVFREGHREGHPLHANGLPVGRKATDGNELDI
jgi:hypothetical protein